MKIGRVTPKPIVMRYFIFTNIDDVTIPAWAREALINYATKKGAARISIDEDHPDRCYVYDSDGDHAMECRTGDVVVEGPNEALHVYSNTDFAALYHTNTSLFADRIRTSLRFTVHTRRYSRDRIGLKEVSC